MAGLNSSIFAYGQTGAPPQHCGGGPAHGSPAFRAVMLPDKPQNKISMVCLSMWIAKAYRSPLPAWQVPRHHCRRSSWLQMCAEPRAGSGKTYTMTGLLADADQVTHPPLGMRGSIRQATGTRETSCGSCHVLACSRVLGACPGLVRLGGQGPCHETGAGGGSRARFAGRRPQGKAPARAHGASAHAEHVHCGPLS